MTDGFRRAAMAERAARTGGAVADEQFREGVAVETKTDRTDLVTAADRSAQRRILSTIRGGFPDDAFVCEEDADPADATAGAPDHRETVPDTGPAWVIDPIDGTANYVRGIAFWATSVAAVVGGDTVAAATVLPAKGEVYAAGPEGATRDGTELAVSDRADPAIFAVGLLGRLPGGDAYATLFRDAADRVGDLRRLGCMQGTLALVASGGLDAAITPAPTQPWDTIAGVHLIRQAGGTVTDLRGNPWTPDSVGLVASNGQAHEELLAVARAGTDGPGQD